MNYNSKLILGTVQFGLEYGINNILGKPSISEALGILNFAYEHGITNLDTAPAYGNAEEIIGTYHKQNPKGEFEIITKFHCRDRENVTDSIESTLKKTGKKCIDVLLFHSFQDYLNDSQILDNLIAEKEKGNIAKIGVSAYDNNEIEALLNDSFIEVIQLPFNLLDNEKLRGEILERTKKTGKIVHIRSAFLQGLFFKKLDDFPEKLTPLKPSIRQIKHLANESNVSLTALALQYVLHKEYIDGVVIGVESLSQLASNLKALNESIDKELLREIDRIHTPAKYLLNPSNWTK